MKYQLPLVFGILASLSTVAVPAQPITTQVVPLGQLDGPRIREMSGTFCGPYFTMTPTDANGGGFVHLAVAESPTETTVVSFPVKAIRVKWCESCEAPQFSQSGDASTVHAELSMSRDQWKVSPCLRSAKVDKR